MCAPCSHMQVNCIVKSMIVAVSPGVVPRFLCLAAVAAPASASSRRGLFTTAVFEPPLADPKTLGPERPATF